MTKKMTKSFAMCFTLTEANRNAYEHYIYKHHKDIAINQDILQWANRHFFTQKMQNWCLDIKQWREKQMTVHVYSAQEHQYTTATAHTTLNHTLKLERSWKRVKSSIHRTWGSNIGSEGPRCCSILKSIISDLAICISHFFLLANASSTASKLASGWSPTIIKCSKSEVGSLYFVWS